MATITALRTVGDGDPVMLANCQTVEDAEPSRWPRMSLHYAQTSYEFVRYGMRVRRPWSCADYPPELVIRLSQTCTRVTCALEVLRVE